MVGPRPLDGGGPPADPARASAPASRSGLHRARRNRGTAPWPWVAGEGDTVTAVPRANGSAPGPTEHGNVVLDPEVQPGTVPEPAPDPAPEPVPPPTPAQADVWALVRRAQEGDVEAFAGIYDSYVAMVHRYVHHRVGDRTTAEDVTSETFVRALRRIDSLSFQGRDVGAWLLTIARNIVLDHVKSSRYRLEVSTADMRDADTVTDGPEDAVVQRLTNQTLLECLRELRPEQQECLALRFLQGLSVAETAVAMGKREGAVKALQHRALRRLAARLPEGLW